jgi:hypothetical protein
MLKGNIQETYKTIETLHICELYEYYMLDVVVRALPLVNKKTAIETCNFEMKNTKIF